MKFVLDPVFMQSGYRLLTKFGPLAGLEMPPRVGFFVLASRKHRGTATLFDGDLGQIELSRTLIKDASEGLAMMAHEMLHLAQSMAEEDGDDFHGPWFRKHGKRLCRYYGWSHEQFGLRG